MAQEGDVGSAGDVSFVPAIELKSTMESLATISELKKEVRRIVEDEPATRVSIPMLLQHMNNDVRKVDILIVGPAGAGKSTLTNTLLLEYVSDVKRGMSTEPITSNLDVKVKTIAAGHQEVLLRIGDCPGFNVSKEFDDNIITQIKEKMPNPDLLIVCFDINAFGGRRLDIHDSHIEKLMKVNDGRLFNNCAIAMTQVNKLSDQYERDAAEEAAEEAANSSAEAPNTPPAHASPAPAWHGELLKGVGEWAKQWKNIFQKAGLEDEHIKKIPICVFGQMKFNRRTSLPESITPIGPWGQEWLRENWHELVNAGVDELVQLFFIVSNKFQLNTTIAPELRQHAPDGKNLKFKSETKARIAFFATASVVGLGAMVSGFALAPFTWGLSFPAVAAIVAGSSANLYDTYRQERLKTEIMERQAAEEKEKEEGLSNMFSALPASEVLDNLDRLEKWLECQRS